MKRLFATIAFIAGGFATEIVRPIHCSLLHVRQITDRRRKGTLADAGKRDQIWLVNWNKDRKV